MTEDEIADLRSRCTSLMSDVASRLVEDNPDAPGTRRFIPSLWPDPTTINDGIRSDLAEFEGVKFKEEQDFVGQTVERQFVTAIADVMLRRMEEDDSIVVMGEDIHKLNGGPRGATKGLKDAFPDRVLGTPISEAAFTGLAGGIALDLSLIHI